MWHIDDNDGRRHQPSKTYSLVKMKFCRDKNYTTIGKSSASSTKPDQIGICSFIYQEVKALQKWWLWKSSLCLYLGSKALTNFEFDQLGAKMGLFGSLMGLLGAQMGQLGAETGLLGALKGQLKAQIVKWKI